MIRSPLFYVGDKYKLMPQLSKLFPKEIGEYIEPFYGGGSSQLYVNADTFILNDIDENIIKIHQMLNSYKFIKELFFEKIFAIINEYGLSCSYKGLFVPEYVKKQFPKTYYAKYNKEGYSKLRKDYNQDKSDIIKLYILLIYGFNHMIRFNKCGDFNLPVGNVDFNKNVYQALNDYFEIQHDNKIIFSSIDFEKILKQVAMDKKTFVYLDPPYFISQSEYNKMWSERDESRLYELLDSLNSKGIKFGITNLVSHKGKTNSIFKKWAEKYNYRIINSNYISFNDNTIKNSSLELFVYNY